MRQHILALALVVSVLGLDLSVADGGIATTQRVSKHRAVSFSTTTGSYAISFRSSRGVILITPKGKKVGLALRELGPGKGADLLYGVKKVNHTSSAFVLSGRISWGTFVFKLDLPRVVPGLLHVSVTVTPSRDMPAARRIQPDVQLVGAPARTLTAYDAAPPVAGTSIYVSNESMDSSILYLADLTPLGSFFDRTSSGATQPSFTYPRAGGKGGLVGVDAGRFGYEPPTGSLSSLPHRKSTLAVDSYLYLLPGVPKTEAEMAGTYLHLLGTIYGTMPKPAVPPADWHSLAAKAAVDLSNDANFVSIGGTRFLVSYVSDSRKAPELITQASVLAGVAAYEARYHDALPLDPLLTANLAAFYDPAFHTVKNGLGHDPAATEESWYYVTNLISLLQLARLGNDTARRLLLDSIGGAMQLAHVNGYEFPQSFHFSDWNGKGTGLQPDVAGGYAWLMLGLYDLTEDGRYLDEAKRSIAHVQGKGFGLAYETHMLAYTAAAAQRLYAMTGDEAYRAGARLALANLFHVTRLWDCTYGNCRKGAGYHTYFGMNPLPWSDYIAMREQYEAWLGLRDYLTWAGGEPAYLLDLVKGFLAATPSTMQYALPPLLPPGVAGATPAEYGFVPRNNLSWNIPLEDLREGESNSGTIGQEIYGAGGAFMFAAYGP